MMSWDLHFAFLWLVSHPSFFFTLHEHAGLLWFAVYTVTHSFLYFFFFFSFFRLFDAVLGRHCPPYPRLHSFGFITLSGHVVGNGSAHTHSLTPFLVFWRVSILLATLAYPTHTHSLIHSSSFGWFAIHSEHPRRRYGGLRLTTYALIHSFSLLFFSFGRGFSL